MIKSFGLLILRLSIGTMLIHHGYEKTADIENFANAFVRPLGLPFPPPPLCIDHPNQKVNEGSASVFVNDRPIARVGDSVDISGQITEGESSVVAGG